MFHYAVHQGHVLQVATGGLDEWRYVFFSVPLADDVQNLFAGPR
jgi:hypothetical protein